MIRGETGEIARLVLQTLVNQTEIVGLDLETGREPLRIFKQPFKAF